MNKEQFKARMMAAGSCQLVTKTFRITCNAREIFDRHITYHVQAVSSNRTIYVSEETNLDQAVSIVETLECMIFLSDALFSWIDS